MDGITIGISLNMNVMKIDKDRLVKGGKGKYLNASGFINLVETSQYGDHGFIRQDVSKEEREQGIKGEILGNIKIFATSEELQALFNGNQRESGNKYTTGQGSPPETDEELPF